jgi:hypothetical protein
VRFGRLLRLNFSKSGVSLGVGPPGANVNLSSRGVRRTFGLPGTGLYHQTFSKWKAPAPPNQSAPTAPGPASKPLPVGRLLLFGAFAIVVALVASNQSKPTHTPGALPQMDVSTQGQAQPFPSAVPSLDRNRALNLEEVREVQIALKQLGFDPGPADGIVGPLTMEAVRQYETARQRTPTGVVDESLRQSLREERGVRPRVTP